jgi:hypothetical protein
MQTSKKWLSTDSPHKIQTDMTLFAGKCSNNKNIPNKSYAQVTSGIRFDALSDPEEEKDKEMVNALTSDSSDTTPRQGNAKTKESLKINKLAHLCNLLPKKSQRKIAKAFQKILLPKSVACNTCRAQLRQLWKELGRQRNA